MNKFSRNEQEYANALVIEKRAQYPSESAVEFFPAIYFQIAVNPEKTHRIAVAL